MNKPKNRVFILAWCRSMEQIYGATLTFKTIRKGYPNSQIFVYDNCTIPPATVEIIKACESIGASYQRLGSEVMHHDFIRWVLNQDHGGDQVVIADPDLIFWENMENLTTDKLLAGRLIPTTETHGIRNFKRIHPSLVLIPDSKRLMEKVRSLEGYFLYTDLFRPFVVMMNGTVWRWDTMAALYSAISEECEVFDASILDKYDHLFSGSHVDLIQAVFNMTDENMAGIRGFHKRAVETPEKIRGAWREQDEEISAQLVTDGYQ